MKKKRTVAVITTSRADFGHLYWPIRHMQRNPDLEVRVIALAAHLSPEFGRTVSELEEEDFVVSDTVECLLSSDTDIGMAKTIGVATLGLADVLGSLRPDLLVVIADRHELLAPVSVALTLRVPLAHIEGGEVSEGAIDDAVRNAVTKMSHVHFTPTENARRRVLALGEEAWRVHNVGAPSLDHLVERKLLEKSALESAMGIDLSDDVCVVSYHPVTLLADTVAEAEGLFSALSKISGQIVFCFPNADAGSRRLIRRAEAFCSQRSGAHLFVHLNHLHYWSLLRHARILVGNSSSGIMESASLALPTVNVGIRQQGRERPANVIDVPAHEEAIVRGVMRALSPMFRDSLAGIQNPYGDGHAGQRIARIIAEVPLGEELLVKKALPVVPLEGGKDGFCRAVAGK